MRRILSGFTVISLLLPSGTSFAATSRLEVEPRLHRYQEAIEYVTEQGIMSNFADRTFHPEQSVSRVELIVTVTHDIYSQENYGACFDNIAPKPPAGFSLLFTDVPITASYAPEVCVGMLVGIVSGSPNGLFRPFENANLVEAAKVIGKAYGAAPLPSLRPQPKVPWYESYRYGLAHNDAIPPTVRNLRQELNRGELAYILWKLRDERPAQGFRYKKTSPNALKFHPTLPTVVPSMDADANVIRFSPNAGQEYWGNAYQGIKVVDEVPPSIRPRSAVKPVYREIRKKILQRDSISTEP